jgi:D-threo-aldose 1-dehydrogenase
MIQTGSKTFRDEIGRFHVALDGRRFPLGLGTAYIGQGADEATRTLFQQTLDDAYAAGIRYYDTSAQYGGSEYRVGEFVRRIDRASVFLATKSPIPAALTAREAALHVRQGLRNSLERLGTAQIDLFQIHDIERLDQVLGAGGVLETLIEAREQGLIRYFGLATRFHHLLETAVRHGQFDTILTYTDFTPVQQSARSLIALAAQRGVGVINGSPLAFGLLTGGDPRAKPHLDSERLQGANMAGKLYDFCQAHEFPLLALAMQYPLTNPAINITLSGAAFPEELRATLEAVQLPLPADIWQSLQAETGIMPSVVP